MQKKHLYSNYYGYAGQPIFGIDQTQRCMLGEYKTITQELIDLATKHKNIFKFDF